jgi:regulator of RNase E activity RraA
LNPSPAQLPPFTEATRTLLAGVGAACVANLLVRHGLRNTLLHDVRPLAQGQEPLVGPAYTLRFVPAREDLDSLANYALDTNLHRRAIEECPAGAVLVIDAHGSREGSSMGDMMATRLVSRGVAGVVTDGGYRDSAAIAATGLPCYQRGPAPRATPLALHPVALDEPIGCAGVVVHPGDILLGDQDGVVVIPRHLAADIAVQAADTTAYEEWAARRLAAGRPLFGTFPASTESRAAFDKWVAAGHPGTE